MFPAEWKSGVRLAVMLCLVLAIPWLAEAEWFRELDRWSRRWSWMALVVGSFVVVGCGLVLMGVSWGIAEVLCRRGGGEEGE